MARFCIDCGAELRENAKFCESCGAKVPEEKPAKQFCSSCGKELLPDAAFCRFCGTKSGGPEARAASAQHQVPPQSGANRTIRTSAPTPQTPPSRNLPDYMQPGYSQRVRTERQMAQPARKKGRGLSLFLSLAIAVEFCIAGFKYPGFLKKEGDGNGGGYVVTSGEEFSPDKIRFGSAEKTFVTPDNPVAEFGNGVRIDFGSEGLLSDEEISVREAKTVKNGAYTCKAYDITLGHNDSIELPMLVTASLPLDGGTDAGEVSVRCWDEELEAWVPVYSEVDESGKNVVFYPEHFSVYSLFIEAGKKKDLSAYENKPLYRYLAAQKDITPDTETYLDDYALAARIKSRRKDTAQIISESWLGKQNKKKIQQSLGISAIAAFGGTNGQPVELDSLGGMFSVSPDDAGDATDIAGGAFVMLDEADSALAEDVENFGTAITVVQLFGSLYRNKGDILQTAADNWDTLAKMGADYALKRAGFSTGWLAVVYMVYIGAKKVNEKVDLAYHLGAKDDIEFAYRQFTMNYVLVNGKSGKTSVKYMPGAATNLVQAVKLTTDYLDADEFRLMPIAQNVIGKVATDVATIRTGCELEWGAFLRNLAASTDSGNPSQMMSRIDTTIDNYCRSFWNLDEKTKQAYLKEQSASYGTSKKLSEVWKEPTDEEKEKMITSMKTAIYAANKTIIKDLLDKSYVTMVNNVYREAVSIEKRLNEKLTFVLIDGSGNSFGDARFKESEIKIRQFEFKNKDAFRFTENNGYTVTCTRYAWSLTYSGKTYPKFVDIKCPNEADSGTLEFRLTVPHTTIEINFPQSAEGVFKFHDLNIYSGGDSGEGTAVFLKEALETMEFTLGADGSFTAFGSALHEYNEPQHEYVQDPVFPEAEVLYGEEAFDPVWEESGYYQSLNADLSGTVDRKMGTGSVSLTASCSTSSFYRMGDKKGKVKSSSSSTKASLNGTTPYVTVSDSGTEIIIRFISDGGNGLSYSYTTTHSDSPSTTGQEDWDLTVVFKKAR